MTARTPLPGGPQKLRSQQPSTVTLIRHNYTVTSRAVASGWTRSKLSWAGARWPDATPMPLRLPVTLLFAMLCCGGVLSYLPAGGPDV